MHRTVDQQGRPFAANCGSQPFREAILEMSAPGLKGVEIFASAVGPLLRGDGKSLLLMEVRTVVEQRYNTAGLPVRALLQLTKQATDELCR